MSSLTITGLAFTGFMVLLALFATTGRHLSQSRKSDENEAHTSHQKTKSIRD